MALFGFLSGWGVLLVTIFCMRMVFEFDVCMNCEWCLFCLGGFECV